MPHAPEPFDEGLPYEPAEREPVHYAEQALLGAVLLKPELLSRLAGLESSAFFNPAHAALFSAMGAEPVPERPGAQAGLEWLRVVLEEARKEAPALTAAYLHLLISACPRTEHVEAYAAMVRGAHARRTIQLHADALTQAARDVTVPDRPKHVLAAADALARQLDTLALDFPSHPGSLPRTPVPPPPPRVDTDEAVDQEQMLLASAVSEPSAVKEMRWLVGDDFTRPLHAGLWQCVSALVHRGEPVDPVTTLWEAQHRGLLAAGIPPAGIVALLSTSALPAEYWGNQIIERSLIAHASHTASRITAYADDPANTVHQLITGGRRALADLNSVRRRWQAARTPASSPLTTRPATPAASRADPPRSRLPAASQPPPHPASPRPAVGRTP
ncbi:DnaB-like helicase N-terminal domain-containing protein [Streptomyces sp. NPDC054835]|uniref:DnaB-like helicase N-terminal domain-containing protein n=1 Tax=Streptomyces exfoliatus TaxID=1905 RepID=UPI00046508D9|nr:DnaB-like helicase N-terminal domain-containing protein [Streptomyces exfoliatus]